MWVFLGKNSLKSNYFFMFQVLYCTKALGLKSDYIRDLTVVCPQVEVYNKLIDLKSHGLLEDSTEPKLLIIDDLFNEVSIL